MTHCRESTAGGGSDRLVGEKLRRFRLFFSRVSTLGMFIGLPPRGSTAAGSGRGKGCASGRPTGSEVHRYDWPWVRVPTPLLRRERPLGLEKGCGGGPENDGSSGQDRPKLRLVPYRARLVWNVLKQGGASSPVTRGLVAVTRSSTVEWTRNGGACVTPFILHSFFAEYRALR